MGFLSKLFGKKEDPLEKFKREVWRLIDDEEYQNSLVNELVHEMVVNGASVDKLPGATGHFGFDKDNPVPVNGALGELVYLSRLETNQGERLLFHRIGAVNMIDVFEAVAYSGSSKIGGRSFRAFLTSWLIYGESGERS